MDALESAKTNKEINVLDVLSLHLDADHHQHQHQIESVHPAPEKKKSKPKKKSNADEEKHMELYRKLRMNGSCVALKLEGMIS